MTHIFSRALGLAFSKNRRDIGRIKWGNVTKNTLLSFFSSKNQKK